MTKPKRISALATLLAVLTTPAWAVDINGDGKTDLHDVDAMRSVMFTDDTVADINRDGRVDFADLGRLRAVMYGEQDPLAATGGDVLRIELLPAARNVAPGATVSFNVYLDFRDEATLGGSVSLLFNTAAIEFVDWTYDTSTINDDPDFRNPPLIDATGVRDITTGSFFGLTGPGIVGTLTVSGLAVGTRPIDAVQGTFDWVSLVTVQVQSPQFAPASLRVDASPAPDIEVTPVPPEINFGNVGPAIMPSAELTVRNVGAASLVLGAVGGADPLGPPFSIIADSCSGATLATAETCALTVQVDSQGPTGVTIDTFDVPSNDPQQPTLTASVEANFVTPSPAPRFSTFGVLPTVAICANADNGENFTVPLDNESLPLNCRSEGLNLTTDDLLVMSIVGLAQNAVPAANVSLLTILNVQCLNITTGQESSFLPTGQAFNCALDGGLAVSPGDNLSILVRGRAQ